MSKHMQNRNLRLFGGVRPDRHVDAVQALPKAYRVDKTFLERVRAKAEEPDALLREYEEHWRRGAAGGAPLHEYLGLSTSEYARVKESPDCVYLVLYERRQSAPMQT